MNITRQSDTIFLQDKGVKISIVTNKSVVIDAASATTIDWPGEYEVQGVTVRAFQEENGLSLLISYNQTRFFVPAKAALQQIENDLEELGGCDVLLISAESSEWTAKEWKKFVEDLEPRMIIFCEDGEKSDKLRKEIGAEHVERIDKIDIQPKNLPSDTTLFMVLTSS